jgi:hypothetical protein
MSAARTKTRCISSGEPPNSGLLWVAADEGPPSEFRILPVRGPAKLCGKQTSGSRARGRDDRHLERSFAAEPCPVGRTSMADNPFDLGRWMAFFGYSQEWIDLEFIDIAFVREQAARFERGPDRDIEHYKWAAYRRVLENSDFSNRERWREFVRLIEADPNEHLYRVALAELLDSDRVPTNWLLEYETQSARFLSVPSVRRKIEVATRRRFEKKA